MLWTSAGDAHLEKVPQSPSQDLKAVFKKREKQFLYQGATALIEKRGDLDFRKKFFTRGGQTPTQKLSENLKNVRGLSPW